MPNRLSAETSPYLLQHAGNPVAWYPWGPEALERAETDNKPIFLSIGYAACHWCHVMAHESFEDPQIAALLNENFISIKVDREERPDIDSIYMNAVVAMTGQGGWPMSLFLTPDGKPFYGGTYYPPSPRHGMPAFRQVLEGISASWTSDRKEIDELGQKIADHLQHSNQWSFQSADAIQPALLQQAVDSLSQKYDWQQGGWGDAPKFPQPMVIDFLLTQVARGNAAAREMTLDVLDKMSRGGMYDSIGGGFHRYSTDAHWLIPHFEKMLYDNAQLALVYLHAFLLTGDPFLRQICEQTLDFILREMTHPQGGFYSSLDADSEGQEGKYYVWSFTEIQSLFPDPQDINFLQAIFHLDPNGNFEDKIVFQQIAKTSEIARSLGLGQTEFHQRWEKMRAILLAQRAKRIRPATDDKILVSWNAFALQAFAEAGRYLKRQDYLDAAVHNARFLLSELLRDETLHRAWRIGQAKHSAYLEDHAALAIGLFSLYQADPNPIWSQTGQKLVQDIQAHFSDHNGGFFDTSDHQDPLMARPKEIQDNATPSGNALAVYAMLLLFEFSNQTELREQAETLLGALQETLAQYPTAFGYWLKSLDFIVGPVQQIALLGAAKDPHFQTLLSTIEQSYSPRRVIACAEDPIPSGSPLLLQDRPLQDHQPTVYVCEAFTCLLPVNTVEQLRAQLKGVTLSSSQD